jgi:parallel beta-helix repeat protein
VASRRHSFLQRIRGYRKASRPAREPRSAFPRLETLEDRLTPSTFTVTNANDSGAGSLRQAILSADAASGSSRIVFKIKGPSVITLQSALPAITKTMTLDGTTEPNYNGEPLVVLYGANAGSGVNGLTVEANNVVVDGLAINAFQADGVRINGPAATHTKLVDDQIMYNGFNGVSIVNSANNEIGDVGQGNVISNNVGDGVLIYGSGSVNNYVRYDDIGTLDDEATAGGNGANGVEIYNGASSNTVAHDLISTNAGAGVWIHDAGTTNNTVRLNFIGTNSVDSTGLGNGTNGVVIGYGATNNRVVDGNVIGGNNGDGVYLFSDGTSGNTVSGNYIGTDPSGTIALGNTLEGVGVWGANGNTVSHNSIAYNGDFGVLVDGANQVTALSNSVFGNTNGGIGLFDGANNNQAAPVLNTAVDPGAKTVLTGTLANANTLVHLQVFEDTPSGQVLVFSGWVHTDNNGNFKVKLDGVTAGEELTATVTLGGNTSEFADDITVTA